MSGNEHQEMIQEQDRFLPIANIARIMKRVVPGEGKLSKESKECVQECVTEFIQFVVSEASDNCTSEKRKTITCEDLLRALGSLSFEPYVDVLKTYIENFRAASKANNNGNNLLDSSKIAPNFLKTEIKTDDSEVGNAEVSSLEQVQLFMDSTSGQHYMFVHGKLFSRSSLMI